MVLRDENEARKQRIRSAFQDGEIQVEKIPPREDLAPEQVAASVVRVAPYCRVSTLSEMQAESYELQKQYYNEYIQKHPNWELVDIYADEGISATSVKNRKEFIRLMNDCKNGKIDLIITKSVSRFARNVVDCLEYARMLKCLTPPVGVYFETENINTLTQNGELLLTVLAAFAQDESMTKSISVAWGIRQRFAKGIPKLVALYGYRLAGDHLERVEEEAKIVERIFKLYLHGWSTSEIAKALTADRIPSPSGKERWAAASVSYIIGNERYTGDIIMQKSICVDLFAHKRVRNYGHVQRSRIRDVHAPVIDKRSWAEAKNRLTIPEREVEVLDGPAGPGALANFNVIHFKEDIDI